MTTITVNGLGPTSLGYQKAIYSADPTPWTRPAEWLTLPSVANTDQKVVGLLAVENSNSNFVNILATTSSGTYTVDWGDGSITTHTSGVNAEYSYTYSSVSSNLTSEGHKQAIVQVYPTTVGANLNLIAFQRPTKYAVITGVSAPWLDIAMAGNFANITMYTSGMVLDRVQRVQILNHGNMSGNTSNLFRDLRSLQSLTFDVSQGATNPTFFNSMFQSCYRLTSIPNTAVNPGNVVSNTGSMFNSCFSLIEAPTISNTSAVTNMTSMFSSCYSLTKVPSINTSSVTAMGSMFSNCYNLPAIPVMDTSKVTNTSTMFFQCVSLTSIPPMDTSNSTNFSSMFNSCFNLVSVPPLVTNKGTTFLSMFNACYQLTRVPYIETGNATSIGTMFNGCYSLQSIPNLNTPLVNNTQSTFASCYSLKVAPTLDTSNVTNMSGMFNSCWELTTVPTLNTAKTTTALNMFYLCYSLKDIPSLNLAACTTTANMFQGCLSLKSVNLTSTGLVANMAGMFAGSAIENIGTVNCSAVSSDLSSNSIFQFSGVSSNNIKNVVLANLQFTANLASMKMSNTELIAFFNGLGTANSTSSKVINITTAIGNNDLTAADRLIATNKGWTLVG